MERKHPNTAIKYLSLFVLLLMGGFLFSSMSETQLSVNGVEVKHSDVSPITAHLQLHLKGQRAQERF